MADMKGYVENIAQKSLENEYFRQVLYTDERVQLVVMSLNAGEDIGEETHPLDQFIRVEQGSGVAVLNGVEHEIVPGSAIIVPKGTRHNIENRGDGKMKLYTLYAPPNHKDGTVHKTRADADADPDDYWDGSVSE